MHAAYSGHLDVVKLLLDKGASTAAASNVILVLSPFCCFILFHFVSLRCATICCVYAASLHFIFIVICLLHLLDIINELL